MLSNYWGDGDFTDPFFGKMYLFQTTIKLMTNQSTGKSYRQFTTYEIPYSKCEQNKNFFYLDTNNEVSEFGIDNYMCPDWQNLTI